MTGGKTSIHTSAHALMTVGTHSGRFITRFARNVSAAIARSSRRVHKLTTLSPGDKQFDLEFSPESANEGSSEQSSRHIGVLY